MKDYPVVIHVPHSSFRIPKEYRNQFIISDRELGHEIEVMTDHYTDEMVSWYKNVIRFDYSRLLVDVERFWDEKDEPMSKVGMGATYKLGHMLQPIRRNLDETESSRLKELFDAHHKQLEDSVDMQIKQFGRSLIMDLHSYPNKKLLYETSSGLRPELCIGTDSFHSPDFLKDTVSDLAQRFNLDAKFDTPFSGSLVPIKFYQKDKRVSSIMLEWRRDFYLTNGKKIPEKFKFISNYIRELLFEGEH